MKKTLPNLIFCGFSAILLFWPLFSFAADLPKIEKVYPTNNKMNVPLDVTLKWKTISQADAYNIIVTKPGANPYTWDWVVADDEDVTTQSLTLPTGSLIGGEPYDWDWCVEGLKVSSVLEEGKLYDYEDVVITSQSLGPCDFFRFYTVAAGQTELSPPSNLKASGQTFPLSFSWSKVEEANAYWWQITGYRKKDDGSFEPMITGLPSGIAESNKAEINNPFSLSIKAEYPSSVNYPYTFTLKSCQDKSCSSSGRSKNSSQVGFRVTLEKPKIVSPKNGVSLDSTTALLKWTESVGAESYRLVGTSIDESVNKNNCSSGNCSFELAGLKPGLSYTWQVKAEREGETFSSAQESFKISANASTPPPPEPPGSPGTSPINPTPANGATNISLTPQLAWGPVLDAPAYSPLIINNGWSGIVVTSNALYVPEGVLTGDTTYSWKVRVCKDSSCKSFGAESAVWAFTTVTAGKEPPGGTPPETPGTPGAPSNGGGICPEGQICNPLKYGNFSDLISAINKFIFIVAIVLAPIMFIIAGIMLVTSTGDPAKVKKAQMMMIYTGVGLAIVILAQALVAVLKNVLGVNEPTTYLPLLFSSLGLELKKTKVDKVFSQIKNIL